MVPVLNAAVRADGAGVETDLTGVAADLLTRRPQTGPGVLLEGQARDPGDAGDQRLPLGVQLVSKTSTNRCSWRRRRSRGCRRGGARRRAWPVFHAGWAGSASPGPAGHFGGPREAVLLTMQGIGGEQHAGQAQVLHQRRHGRDLAPATSWWARMRAASLAKALST